MDDRFLSLVSSISYHYILLRWWFHILFLMIWIYDYWLVSVNYWSKQKENCFLFIRVKPCNTRIFRWAHHVAQWTLSGEKNWWELPSFFTKKLKYKSRVRKFRGQILKIYMPITFFFIKATKLIKAQVQINPNSQI